MQLQRLSNDWLFERHSEEQIRRWIINLKYSYFKRAWGGHANDGDEFKLTLSYQDKEEFLDIVSRLDLPLVSVRAENSEPVPGKAYTAEEYSAFKSLIKDFPEYEQPKRIKVNGVDCFCWIENGKIDFSFSGGQDGNFYDVSETDFRKL